VGILRGKMTNKNPRAVRGGSENSQCRPEQSHSCTKPAAPSIANSIFPENKSDASNKKIARRRRRQAKKRTSRNPARELFFYEGQICLGVVKIAGTGRTVAYDARGKRLGQFISLEAAASAFHKSPSSPDVA